MIVRPAVHADVADTALVAASSYARAFATILELAPLARYDAAFFRARFFFVAPRAAEGRIESVLIKRLL